MVNRAYQRVAARYIARTRSALIADDPGLGKTLEIMAGIVEAEVNGPYLVVCPKTAVESVWIPEIKRWLGIDAFSVPEGRAKREAILDAILAVGPNASQSGESAVEYDHSKTWVVVHPEMIRTKSWWVCSECGDKTQTWAGPKQLDCEHEAKGAPRVDEHAFPQLFQIDWGAVVFDESHNSLIRKSGKGTQTRNGAELLPIRESGVRVAASGTPFRGKKHLLWGTLNWLRPREYTGATRWINTYFKVREGWGGSVEIGDVREDRLAELHKELDKIMLRRTKGEVAPDMPEKTYVGTPLVPGDENSPVGVWLPMSTRQASAYKQMFETSVASIDGGDLNAIGILAEMTRLKQFSTSYGNLIDGNEFKPSLPSNKFEWLLEHIEEMGIPDKQNDTRIVIVSQFTSVLGMYAEELRVRNISTCNVTGKVTGRNRARVIRDFNTPGEGPEVMLLNVKAGGVAITIDTADEMVFLDETFIDDEQRQAEDRIHRVSKPRPVFYYYLRSLNSIEERIASVTAEQRRSGHELLDGRRGVEFARKVLGI